MTKGLERDLSLYAVVTISIGAMIGSGIFVLPGLASTMAGPAAVLAYLLAGLLVLPAALSKAEMASALPESGGTYLYIDRAMGPMLGTIAGIGTWFSLVFKSAFALVGLGAYLVLFADIPTKPIALGIATVLVVVNILGVKQTGRLQAIIVTGVMAVLFLFVADGLTYVERANLHPFLPAGLSGLFAATGFVFVSYAGVTKIASVAEEVEQPGRNIPAGILTSLGVMMAVYSLVVLVILGVTNKEQLGKTLTPMADAAEQFLGPYGELLIAVTAIFALTGMANAGILSSSRYPFAMSRDGLVSATLGHISDRFRTPTWAIAATGGVLLALIALVPVVDLAKLASAFQIMVFSLVNLALIVMRESDADWYVPEFRAPGYPWLQIAGIIGGVALVPMMGAVPLLGAVGIVVGGYAWYRLYGQKRTLREGAAPDTIRRTADAQRLRQTEHALQISKEETYRVLVALRRHIDAEHERQVISLASHIVAPRQGELLVVRFDEVPDQMTLDVAAAEMTGEEIAFEKRVTELTQDLDIEAQVSEIVSHDTKRAVANYAARQRVDAILGEWTRGLRRWLMSHAPCDVMFVRPRDLGPIRKIAVIADRGPHDPLEVQTADAIARHTEASVDFLYALPEDVPDAQVTSIEAYHQELSKLCSVAVESHVLRAQDREAALLERGNEYDLVIMGESPHRVLYDVVFGDLPDTMADRSRTSVVLVNSRKPLRHTFLQWVVEKLSYH